jgi:hypothetical protein
MASILLHLLSDEIIWTEMHPEKRTTTKTFAPQVADFAMFSGVPPGGFNEPFVNTLLPF